MTITNYKHVLIAALTIALWSCIAALYLIFCGNWADIIACFALAAAAFIIAASALHQIMFPHDHPSPRYRIGRARQRTPLQ